MANLNSSVPASVARPQVISSQDKTNNSTSLIYPNPNKNRLINGEEVYQQHGYENFEIIHTQQQPQIQNNAAASKTSAEGINPATSYENVTKPVNTDQNRLVPTRRITTVHNDLCSDGSASTINPEVMRIFEEMLDQRNQSELNGASIGCENNKPKYKTSSPGVLFKSIGTTSKRLTESITERLTHQSKMFANKLESSFVNWGSEASSKTKIVNKSINNLADDKPYESWRQSKDGSDSDSVNNEPPEDDFFLERRQLEPLKNNHFLNGIHFESPLSNTVNHRAAFVSSTYEIPKSVKSESFNKTPPCLNSMNVVSTPSLLQRNNRNESNVKNSRFYVDPVNEIEATNCTDSIASTKTSSPVPYKTEESLTSGENQYEEMNNPEQMMPNSSEKENHLLETLKVRTLEASCVTEDQIYEQVCEMEDCEYYFKVASIYEIIDQLDPEAHRQSLTDILEKVQKDNNLSLIENMLSAKPNGADQKETPEHWPNPSQKLRSLIEKTVEKLSKHQPPLPRRIKERSPKESTIMSKNLNQPSKGIEKLVDDTKTVSSLAVVKKAEAKQSNWFISDDISAPEADTFTNLNSSNERADDKAVVKEIEQELQCELTRNVKDINCLSTQREAVGEIFAAPEALAGTLSGNRSSVTYQLTSTLKQEPNPQSSKTDTSMLLEMIPKPPLTERLIIHRGIVLKSLTGMVAGKFNEWIPCSMVLREKFIQTYNDMQRTQPKETLQLKVILSLQSIAQPKLNNKIGHDLYCFEVVLETNFTENQQLMVDPKVVTTSRNYGNVQTQRQSHIFGVQKKSDRNLWMAKIMQSVTDVFPDSYLTEFTRAGWCYMKNSVSSSWSGAWLLLSKRKLYFFNNQHQQLGLLDLRNARYIGDIESDESIRNLHTEPGPALFIDCLPYATLYFIMASPRETQIWKKIINHSCHLNETSEFTQHLTKHEVPVLIDKCINFIYVNGSMSEGIYRKSGSSIKVSKIIQLFTENAFAVQLTREDFNEHDVAGALKKFIRDIPDSFLGSYANSFVSIASLKFLEHKISSYKQLLSQLPKIEYQTLKKLIGHLSFIASLEKHNRMDIANLALIWGPILIANSCHQVEIYPQAGADVLVDLIKLYKHLYPISPEEFEMEQLMLKVIQKYHAAAKSLFDAVKNSSDLKVWIKIECDLENTQCAAIEDQTQCNVTMTPAKTASDICKELASKTSYEWYKLTLFEVISDGALTRPVHYNEKALEIVLKWANWDDADRKGNYLAVRPTITLSDVLRIIQQAPLLTPTMELKFADQRTKVLQRYKLKLIGREIVVFKQIGKKKRALYEKLLKINLKTVHAYLGKEAKRDQSSVLWTITLMEHNFKKRTCDAPFLGYIMGGIDFTEQTLWYSSILHSLYQDDILPSSDFYPSTWWTGRRPLSRK